MQASCQLASLSSALDHFLLTIFHEYIRRKVDLNLVWVQLWPSTIVQFDQSLPCNLWIVYDNG